MYLSAFAGVELEALGEAGAAERVLGRHLRQVQPHGVLQCDVVMLSHQHVMEEAKACALCMHGTMGILRACTVQKFVHNMPPDITSNSCSKQCVCTQQQSKGDSCTRDVIFFLSLVLFCVCC